MNRQHLRRWILCVAAWLCGGGAGCAQAAEFLLASGGVVEGELLNPQQQPRTQYLIQTGAGRIALAREQVDRVVTVSEDLQWYRQSLPAVPDTVEGHWSIAEQCRERNLDAQRKHHLNQILRLDPEHKEARYGLGFSRVDDRWIQTDQWMQQQGYIRYQGSWRIAQDVALEKAAEQVEKSAKDWRKKIKAWRTWILKSRGRELEAMAAIKAIQDPAASAGLVEILNNETDPRALRLLCIDVLGRLRSSLAGRAFIERAMSDRDASIRDACLDQLSHFGTLQASRAFQTFLRSPDNTKVSRAAACLGLLGSAEATLPLINALVTEHKFMVQSAGGTPGQLNLGFGSGGGGGGNSFGVGGRPKIFKQNLSNEAVLNALVALWPGINFGYDEEAWRAWYADQQTPDTLNLRRSE